MKNIIFIIFIMAIFPLQVAQTVGKMAQKEEISRSFSSQKSSKKEIKQELKKIIKHGGVNDGLGLLFLVIISIFATGLLGLILSLVFQWAVGIWIFGSLTAFGLFLFFSI